MKFSERYQKNTIFNQSQQLRLSHSTVAIIGLGGLGGYAAELLARSGVGKLLLVDGDYFTESNLNRQLFCTENNIGMLKAAAAAQRVLEINSQVDAVSIPHFVNENNLKQLVAGADVILDCLDTPAAKLMLQEGAKKMNLPLVHGAIGDWFGQVATIFPGQDTLSRLYQDSSVPDDDSGNVSFAAAHVAALQVCEALKLLSGTGNTLSGKILMLDLYSYDTHIISL